MSDKTFKQQVAPYVCIYGEDYIQGNTRNCECVCAEWDAEKKQCRDIDAILSAHNAELAKVLCLCNKIIELAEHGDYSNGNTDGVIDEGTVLAMNYLKELKDEFAYIQAQKGS